MPARLLGQEVAIDLLIPALEEDRLAPIAPLGHVVRKTWNDDAGEASHARNLQQQLCIFAGDRYAVPVTP